MKIDIKKKREECIALLRSTGREGIEDMIIDLDKMGFFTAPAAVKHHLNCDGGLAQHSLNTYKAAIGIWESMKTYCPYLAREIQQENIIIAALLHDICKCDVYKKRRESKGRFWSFGKENLEYCASYDEFPIGHGEKSVILALCAGLVMTDSEMVAIRWHMGLWGVNMDSNEDRQSYRAAEDKYPLVTIIQTADTLAAKIMEQYQ